MIFAEKEDAYSNIYRAGKQAKNIWKYIPVKYREGVTEAFSDSDGYWIYLNKEYAAYDCGEDCGIIHEYNIDDLRNAIKTIKKCKRR